MKLFLYRAKSDEDFVEVAQREGCDMIIVEPKAKARHFGKSATLGSAGFYQYFLKISAVNTPLTRKVILKKFAFERTAEDRGAADEEDRKKSAIRIFLMGEKEMQKFREKLPGATVIFQRITGEAIDLEQVHRDAAQYGVSLE